MSLRLGSNNIAAYLGSTAVLRAYIGSTLVIGSDPVGEPVSALKANTHANPPFSLNLGWSGPADMNHSPFINWLKVGEQFRTSGTPYMEWDALLAGGNITSEGVVNSIPAGADNVIMFVLGYLPAYTGLSGRYRLYYTGAGDIAIFGGSNEDRSVAGQIDFDYVANGSTNVGIAVISVTSPIRFVALVNHLDLADYASGVVFRPAWLDIIRNSRILRFKDWAKIDTYTGAGRWADRYSVNRVTYQGVEGVPAEVMIDACNLVGADPWFCLPGPADNDYAAQLAALALSRLDAKRHVYVELSNKVWDSSNWATADYFRDLADAWFDATDMEACMEAYGGRSAEVFAVCRTVWTGANAARLHTVLQPWTAVPYLSTYMLDAPRWVAMVGGGALAPWHSTTEYALHANLDGGLRYDWVAGTVTTIQGWIDTLTTEQVYDNFATACRAPYAGLEGYTISGHVGFYADHATLLTSYPGLNVVGYEGGSHMAVPPPKTGDPVWVALYNDFHRTPQWAAVFDDMIDAWYVAFPGPSHVFNRMCDVRRPDINNSEGLLWWIGDSTSPQWGVWQDQQTARTGATGRGANDFIGAYDLA